MSPAALTPYPCVVINERSRGIVLYSLTAAVLLAGGLWYFRADPAAEAPTEMAAWSERAEAALPEMTPGLSETVILAEDGRTERTTSVDGGPYTLSMVCAGSGGQVRVWMSTRGPDSGRAVPCSSEVLTVDRIKVALVDELFLRMAVESDVGGVVFRWRLERAGSF